MGGFSDIFLFPEGIFLKEPNQRMKFRRTNKVGKFEVKKVKNKGAVTKNVVRVAISPHSPKEHAKSEVLTMSVLSGPEQKEASTFDTRNDHRKALDQRRFVRVCPSPRSDHRRHVVCSPRSWSELRELVEVWRSP